MEPNINHRKIMLKAAEKTGINTRNGDTYFLEEKPVAGEKLLKMTRIIAEEVEREVRERVQEELNAAGYYDEEESQEQGEELPVEENSDENRILEREILLTIESALEKNSRVIEAKTDRIIRKLEELNNKSEGKNKECSEKDEEPERPTVEKKVEKTWFETRIIEKMDAIIRILENQNNSAKREKSYGDLREEFLQRVEKGLGHNTQTDDKKGMSRTGENDKKELKNKILKQLEEAKPSRGATNARRVVEELLKNKNMELSNRDLSTKSRISINSIRTTAKYLKENIDGIEYVLKMKDGRKQGFLKIKK